MCATVCVCVRVCGGDHDRDTVCVPVTLCVCVCVCVGGRGGWRAGRREYEENTVGCLPLDVLRLR